MISKRDWLSMIAGWVVGLVAWRLAEPSWTNVVLCFTSAFSATLLVRWVLGYFI